MSYNQYRVHCQRHNVPYLSRSEWNLNGSPSYAAYKAAAMQNRRRGNHGKSA